jgi:hypothetical protein
MAVANTDVVYNSYGNKPVVDGAASSDCGIFCHFACYNRAD